MSGTLHSDSSMLGKYFSHIGCHEMSDTKSQPCTRRLIKMSSPQSTSAMVGREDGEQLEGRHESQAGGLESSFS